MSGEKITEAFTGKTVQWTHMTKSRSGTSYYAEDGSLTGEKNGKKRKGKWHLEGDKLCVSWGNCLAIESDGNGGYYKVKGQSKRVVHITSVSESNHL